MSADTSLASNKYSTDASKEIATLHDQAASALADKQIAASSSLADKQIAASSTLADKQIAANAQADARRAVSSLLSTAAQSSASMGDFMMRASTEIMNSDMDGPAKDAAIAQLQGFVGQAATHQDSWLNGTPATEGTPEIPAVTHEEGGMYDPNTGTVGPSRTVVDKPAVPARPASPAKPGILSVIQSLFA